MWNFARTYNIKKQKIFDWVINYKLLFTYSQNYGIFSDMNKFKNGLLDNGVMIAPAGNTVRMVTHREVSSNDVGLIIRAVSKSIKEL